MAKPHKPHRLGKKSSRANLKSLPKSISPGPSGSTKRHGPEGIVRERPFVADKDYVSHRGYCDWPCGTIASAFELSRSSRSVVPRRTSGCSRPPSINLPSAVALLAMATLIPAMSRL